MKLSHLLDRKLVLTGVELSSLEEGIRRLVETVAENYRSEIEFEAAFNHVIERESLGGTSFPTGIAIPHARLDNFDNFLIAVLIPARPVRDSHGNEIRMICLMLISKAVSNLYLNTLARLVKISQDEEFFSSLTASPSAGAFIEKIGQAAIEIKQDLTAADIMTHSTVAVKSSDTLRHLADLMYTKGLRYVPVTDDEGKLVGEVGILDLIRVGIPDYAFKIGSLKFLSHFEPLDVLLKREDEILVREIMAKPVTSISQETSAVEVAFEMTRLRKQHFAVLDQGRLVGVISSTDILSKILRR